MRRVSMVGCVVASALSCLSAPAPAQNSIAERNARAAGANIGEAPAAYHDARMVMARDTTPLNLCGTVYRSLAVPLLTTGTTRVEEVVGSARREPCDPQQGPSPGAPRVAIDSVTYTLTGATVYTRVRRGNDSYSEVAELELRSGRWLLEEIRTSEPHRLVR